MPDLADGESTEMKGSGAKPYQLKNTGGVYSCTCPAWRNQSFPIERRTCKHLRKLRGDAAEETRIQTAEPLKPLKPEGAEDVEKLPLLLAHVWSEEAQDPTGWWMSEKLDGVRAYWDGKQFLSRNNNIFYAPEWFAEGLPPHPLDGELWVARKKFDFTSGLVRQQSKSNDWKQVQYVIFDAPDVNGPFEERLQFLTDGIRSWRTAYAAIHAHIVCTGVHHLVSELDRINQLGGEGLMLRQPGSAYERTRSTTLLKVKTFLDAEAIVMGYEAGAGRHKGRVGALVARFGNGKEFKVGTGMTDKQRENPPAVGSIINVKYQELTKDGIPRFPVYVGLKPDGHPHDLPPSRSASKPTPKKEAPAPEPVKQAAVSPAPVATGRAKTAATPKRYFECSEGGSSKFWEIWIHGKDVTTNWGKIGTTGQTKTKTFADEAKAKQEYDKLLAEKTDKGYTEKQRPA
jgi:DNA ligase-1